MRILLVTHYYPAHAGGIELVAGRLAEMLAAGHDVVWAASDCDAVPRSSPSRLQFVPMRTTNFIERATGLPCPLWGAGSVRCLYRETRRADVVHLHDFAYFGNGAAFLFARAQRKPVLVTQHVGFIPYKNLLLRGLLRAVHATAGRLVLRGAGRVVFVSKVVRDYFGTIVRFRTPPLVVSNGVDSSVFSFATEDVRDTARQMLQLQLREPVCLFVGRFVEKKGLGVLEQLARHRPDVTFVLAGWGPQDPEHWRLPNVRVMRDRRGPDLVALYHAADLLVLPSVGEGLPLVVQEAMSCGTPVLIGDDTAIAVDAPAGLVFSAAVAGDETINRWTSALGTILADTSALARIRSKVADFAHTRWSWERCVSTYEQLLSELAGSSSTQIND